MLSQGQHAQNRMAWSFSQKPSVYTHVHLKTYLASGHHGNPRLQHCCAWLSRRRSSRWLCRCARDRASASMHPRRDGSDIAVQRALQADGGPSKSLFSEISGKIFFIVSVNCNFDSLQKKLLTCQCEWIINFFFLCVRHVYTAWCVDMPANSS